MSVKIWITQKIKEEKEKYDKALSEISLTGGRSLSPKEQAEYDRVEAEEAAKGNYTHGMMPGSWGW